jgi:hypothetical protein
LKISIVTDFEEFAIYDWKEKAEHNDKASRTRIDYLTYQKHLEKFDLV